MSLSKYKFSAELNKPIDIAGYPEEIQVLKEYIDERKGNIVSMNNSNLTFKGSYSRWRGNICDSVKKGEFNIKENNGKLFLEYKIEISQVIVYMTIAGVMVGIFLDWKVSIPLLWLFGINWILALIRNYSMMNNIAYQINNLKKTKYIKGYT